MLIRRSLASDARLMHPYLVSSKVRLKRVKNNNGWVNPQEFHPFVPHRWVTPLHSVPCKYVIAGGTP
jgi:hypothetical protein